MPARMVFLKDKPPWRPSTLAQHRPCGVWYGGNSMYTRIAWTRIQSCVTWDWSSNILTTWCKEPTHWKRPPCWERLRARGEGGDRGWDGWMASLITQWACIWANSGRQWKTEKPRVLQSMESQRAGHGLETEQQQHQQSGEIFGSQCLGFKIFKKMTEW